jgi:serine protease Do
MNASPVFPRRKGLLASGAVGAIAGAFAFGLIAQAQPAPKAPVNARPATASVMPNGMPSFADIVETVAPAVVSIDVEGKAKASPAALQRSPFGLEPEEDSESIPFGPFNFRRVDPEQEAPARKTAGTGSGFFISPDGYIVTNNHVVADADKITVRTSDERTLTARLIGRDEATDLAVIKVEGTNNPYVSFQNQAKPRVGDWVIAVGNPFNLGGTATAGIVSALHRAQPGSNYVDFMQIDAPINRGNSGGPTFDIHGRVVGVNTAIFSPTGGSVGIGFDIPADVAEQVAKQLIASGKVTRGYIGATVQDATQDMAESVGLGMRKAAIIVDTTPGGPSEKAGLQSGDIVLKVNGQDIDSSTALTRQVALAKAGDAIRMDVWRDGKRQTIDVRSGTRPDEARLASIDRSQGGGLPSPARAPAVLGMRLIPGEKGGVTVQSVTPDSAAAEKGLLKGDVILSAGSKKTESPEDVAAVVAQARKDGRSNVLLLVDRAGRKIYVPVEVTEGSARG